MFDWLYLSLRLDLEQVEVLYSLLRLSPHVIRFYCEEYAFPVTMQFQPHKVRLLFGRMAGAHRFAQLSASGQELGGSCLFSRRIGFSGTPSDLLPLEFGGCHYQKGVDWMLAMMFALLTRVQATMVECCRS